MNQPLRILILMLLLPAMAAWAPPAMAARLASVNGQADAQEVRDDAAFRLSEQTEISIGYNLTKRAGGCAAQVRIYRQQNGRWLVVNTVVRSNISKRGSRKITLPAGSYKVEVVATHARYEVTVDN